MSRYLLLLILTAPFVMAGLLSAVTQYKLKRSSKRRFVTQVVLWVVVFTALASAEPIYQWLFDNKLTQTEPLSLFDVVLFAALVFTFYVANRNRLRIDILERRVQDLHKELSISHSVRNNLEKLELKKSQK